jgi:hypothetical protein
LPDLPEQLQAGGRSMVFGRWHRFTQLRQRPLPLFRWTSLLLIAEVARGYNIIADKPVFDFAVTKK